VDDFELKQRAKSTGGMGRKQKNEHFNEKEIVCKDISVCVVVLKERYEVNHLVEYSNRTRISIFDLSLGWATMKRE